MNFGRKEHASARASVRNRDKGIGDRRHTQIAHLGFKHCRKNKLTKTVTPTATTKPPAKVMINRLNPAQSAYYGAPPKQITRYSKGEITIAPTITKVLFIPNLNAQIKATATVSSMKWRSISARSINRHKNRWASS
jgi:hypothetical protein